MTNDAQVIRAKLADLKVNLEEDRLNEVCAQIEQLDDGADLLPDLFALMEENPEFDFGAPGEVVHASESFIGRGYEKHLLQSLHRRPIEHTVWMLNRLINGSSGKEEEKYIYLMIDIASDPHQSAEVRKRAMFYLR